MRMGALGSKFRLRYTEAHDCMCNVTPELVGTSFRICYYMTWRFTIHWDAPTSKEVHATFAKYSSIMDVGREVTPIIQGGTFVQSHFVKALKWKSMNVVCHEFSCDVGYLLCHNPHCVCQGSNPDQTKRMTVTNWASESNDDTSYESMRISIIVGSTNHAGHRTHTQWLNDDSP